MKINEKNYYRSDLEVQKPVRSMEVTLSGREGTGCSVHAECTGRVVVESDRK